MEVSNISLNLAFSSPQWHSLCQLARPPHLPGSFSAFLCTFIRLSLVAWHSSGSHKSVLIGPLHLHPFSCLALSSTAAIVSIMGMGSLVRTGAKFSPMLSTSFCGAVKDWSVMLTSHQFSPWGHSSGCLSWLETSFPSFLLWFSLILGCAFYVVA